MPAPSAGVVDSQSIKTAEAGGPRGYNAGKKIKGRKRHIITDTLGHLIGIDAHPADIKDRDGAICVSVSQRPRLPAQFCTIAGDAGLDVIERGDAPERLLGDLVRSNSSNSFRRA